MTVLRGYLVPWAPHPLLAPDGHPAHRALRDAFDRARAEIAATDATALVLFSTRWPSIIGHQVQADPAPEWVHVDEEFHALGSIPYRFRVDAGLAHAVVDAARARGLHARTVAYRGFPIDTGTIVANTLLNPDNRLPMVAVSCNMYSDRAETLVLGKAVRDALAATGHRAVAVAVSALTDRLHHRPVAAADDHVSSPHDDEWNEKLLAFLAEGRLEDVSQLMRTFATQARADSKGKAIWWLAATLGQHNRYAGTVHAYGPLSGTGAAVVGLVPSAEAAADLEFDEDDVEVFGGDRSVLGGAAAPPPPTAPSAPDVVRTDAAPKPVGAYAHARRVGDLLFVAGMGPRQPGTDAIPGGPIHDAAGAPLPYDAAAQAHAAIANVARVLEAAGSSLADVIDATVFLVDMQRDFAAVNAVWAEHFADIAPTRTTVEVRALPTPIAVELKVVAKTPMILDISPVLSARTAVFPGDVAFRRDVALRIADGANIDLSAITTTVHVGAHADAPSHYVAGGAAIADLPLDRYYGPCRVIAVDVPRGGRIRPADVVDPLDAPRILFRTGTFPDPDRWNGDFASLSPELVDALAAAGVILVGIDTPSVDPADDAVLYSHAAIARHDLAVLEGLVLDHVTPGLYTLIALPLRIEGADASPVRAALVRE